MKTILCRRCNQQLPVERFFASWIEPGTRISRCKSCRAQIVQRWEQANPGYRTAANSRPGNKAWRASHQEYLKAKLYEWRKANPEKWRAIAKRSRQKNIDKILIRNREREILEVAAMPPWADRKKIHAIYAEAKRLTRETGIRHEVDHIYPLKGKTSCGLHVEYNLQILTGTVNRKKFNKLPEEVA